MVKRVLEIEGVKKISCALDFVDIFLKNEEFERTFLSLLSFVTWWQNYSEQKC